MLDSIMEIGGKVRIIKELNDIHPDLKEGDVGILTSLEDSDNYQYHVVFHKSNDEVICEWFNGGELEKVYE